MVEKVKKKAEIKISGMSCAACALNVQKSLKDLEGVDEANVNIGTEKAIVEYNPEKLKLAELKMQ
ncbi:MAG: cation transporter [Methanobacteriaceae archaeon]